jgi:hypothetical protein
MSRWWFMQLLALNNWFHILWVVRKSKEILTYLHFNQTRDFRACNDIRGGMEANTPHMILCKIKWRFHYYLIVII